MARPHEKEVTVASGNTVWSIPQKPTYIGNTARGIFARFDSKAFDAPSDLARKASVMSLVGGTCWIVTAILLLICTAQIYSGTTVDNDRSRYVLVAARRVGAEVAGIMRAAPLVRDAVDYAVRRELYIDPLDTVSLRRIVEPLFATIPALRLVEIAFTNRSEYISLTRLLDGAAVDPGTEQGVAPVRVLLQTDAQDCMAMLGPLGCLRADSASEQAWYELGTNLNGGDEDPSTDTSSADMSWLSAPVFVPGAPDRSDTGSNSNEEDTQEFNWWDAKDPLAPPPGYKTDGATIQWETAYSLVFRTTFPGSQGFLSVIGRVTVELSALRSLGGLVDAQGLGEGGVVLLCDFVGHVLSSDTPGLQVTLDSPSGRIRPRFVWELDVPWAEPLQKVFQVDRLRPDARELTHGDFCVIIEPLRGRNVGNFYILIAARADPIIDVYLLDTGDVAKFVMAWLPLVGFLMAVLAMWCTVKIKRWLFLEQSSRRIVPVDRHNHRETKARSSVGPLF